MLTEAYKSGGNTTVDGNIHGRNTNTPNPQGYTSQDEMVSDMSDPRYDHRSIRYDPAYYKAVRAKATKSNF